MIKRFFEKIKDKIQKKKEPEEIKPKKPPQAKPPAQEQTAGPYPNRFLKFYYLNKQRLNTERRSSYNERKSKGICVRCSLPAVEGIVFCADHQEKQKTYNKTARSK